MIFHRKGDITLDLNFFEIENLTLALFCINLFYMLKIITRNFILVETREILKFFKNDHYTVMSMPLSLDIILKLK